MRWPVFILVAYVMVGLQLAVNGFLQIEPWTPSLPLLLVLFVGLHAPGPTALLAGFVTGVGHDVISAGSLGTYAFCYSVIAGAALQLRQVMYREHPATHAMLTLLCGTLLALLLLVKNAIRAHIVTDDFTSPGFFRTLGMTIASAVLAVPVMYLLRKIRAGFAFRQMES
ncbi:MAG: rod shape-determining protein MreD [Tepidisphaeraceae bacterium]